MHAYDKWIQRNEPIGFVSLTILFGFLTYQNVRESTGLQYLHVDRQLTVMICIQVVLIIWRTIPYGGFMWYSLITKQIQKDTDRILFRWIRIFIQLYVHEKILFF